MIDPVPPRVRLLVAGGAGFIGSRTAVRAREAGIDAAVLVRETSDCRRLPSSVPLITADLTDFAATAEALESIRPTHVVNCASPPGHPGQGGERIAAWRNSVLATVGLLEACRRIPVHGVVHLSSSLVYAESTHPINEQDPLTPTTARGALKLAAETAVRAWSGETSTPVTILRPFSVYGPMEQEDHVVPTLLAAMRWERPFSMTPGDHRRDFVHVDDVVTAILTCAMRSGRGVETFNLGTGHEHTVGELVDVARAVTGRSLIVSDEPFATRPPDRAHWVADASRARSELSWESRSLEEGIRSTWRGLQ